MFCTQCGFQVLDGTNFCPKCGTKLANEIIQTSIEENLNNVISDSKNTSNMLSNKKVIFNFKNKKILLALCFIIIASFFVIYRINNQTPTIVGAWECKIDNYEVIIIFDKDNKLETVDADTNKIINGSYDLAKNKNNSYKLNINLDNENNTLDISFNDKNTMKLSKDTETHIFSRINIDEAKKMLENKTKI